MHQHWNSGASFWGAVRGMFDWKAPAVSLACIMTLVSILRGPLMQRASDVKNAVRDTNGIFTVHAAQQLPHGWAGTDFGRTSSPSIMNPNFTTVAQDYAQHKPMTIVHSHCGETCHTSIEAFGFGISCNKTGLPYNLNPITNKSGAYVSLRDPVDVFTSSASFLHIYGHGLAAELNETGYPTIPTGDQALEQEEYPNTALLLNTTLIDTRRASGIGNMVQHTCALRGGVVSYPVTITNGTVAFQSSSWRNDTFLYDRGLEPYPYNDASNLAGFTLAANNMYSSTAAFQFAGGAGFVLTIKGALANNYLEKAYIPAGGQSQNFFYISNNISFRDPMEDMINGMREIAFRSALNVAQYNLTFPNSTRDYVYTGSQPETIYVSNYRYMAAAMVVSLAGVLAVIPTYRGWWRLGRKVTLSPLEVAKAFDAPLLAGVQSNLGAQRMLKDVGGKYVRYGDVLGGTDGVGSYDGTGRRRLQIMNADVVGRPEKGLYYM